MNYFWIFQTLQKVLVLSIQIALVARKMMNPKHAFAVSVFMKFRNEDDKYNLGSELTTKILDYYISSISACSMNRVNMIVAADSIADCEQKVKVIFDAYEIEAVTVPTMIMG